MNPDKKFWLKKRVFITGHSGFKGTWVYLWLKLLGANVKGYSIDCGFKPKIFKSIFRDHYINQTSLDVRNYDILKKSLISFQPEIIIHMAAQPLVLKSYEQPKETFSTNIVGTFNILDCALKLKHLNSTSYKDTVANLDKETINLINNLFSDDFKFFNYAKHT